MITRAIRRETKARNICEELRKGKQVIEDIETVDEYCPNDCVYRVRLCRSTFFCAYAVMERSSRGCRVSECDKYRVGTKKAVIDSATQQTDWKVVDDGLDSGIRQAVQRNDS